MTHDQQMMVFAIKCNIEDGDADKAGELTRSLTHQLNQPRKQTPKQAAYRFFYAHVGWGYDPKTQTKQQGRAACARRLAKAERDAKALGYWFKWESDWSIGDHSKEFDCYENSGPETCEECWMLDSNSQVVQSLHCIDDATPEYRRVVEAELALEQLG